MAIFEGALLNLGIVALLVPVLADWAHVRKGSEKAYAFIAAAGIAFVLSSAFGLEVVTASVAAPLAAPGAWLFQAVGFILVAVGAIMAIYNTVSA